MPELSRFTMIASLTGGKLCQSHLPSVSIGEHKCQLAPLLLLSARRKSTTIPEPTRSLVENSSRKISLQRVVDGATFRLFKLCCVFYLISWTFHATPKPPRGGQYWSELLWLVKRLVVARNTQTVRYSCSCKRALY